MNRDAALALMQEWTLGDSLRKHALSVSFCCESYGSREAERLGLPGEVAEELSAKYAATGLLHDFDYERYPETHPARGAEELRRLEYPEEIVMAVLGHGDHTGVPRTSLLARTVYACDELSGFVIAVAYVRPSRSLDEVDPHAVIKKMKDRSFARQVPRDQLLRGADQIGVAFEEHVANVVSGLKTVRETLGL